MNDDMQMEELNKALWLDFVRDAFHKVLCIKIRKKKRFHLKFYMMHRYSLTLK